MGLKEFEHGVIDWEHLLVKWVTSRKLTLLLIMFVVACIGLFLKLIDGEHWTDFMKWMGGCYMAANAADGVSDALKKN